MGNYEVVSTPEQREIYLQLIQQISQATWKSIDLMTNPDTGIPYDRIEFDEIHKPFPKGPTSPANIGLYGLSIISARDMQFITPEEAQLRTKCMLDTLDDASIYSYHGLYFNWLDVETKKPAEEWPNGYPIEQFVSSVDNAILIAGLIAISGAFPEHSEYVNKLLKQMEFNRFYDPKLKLAYGRVDLKDRTEIVSPWHYDVYGTDGRLVGLAGNAINKLPPEALLNMGIDSPATVFNHDKGGGHLKSWDGTMFEVCLPGLIIPENEWGGEAYRSEINNYMQSQISYGEKHLDGWFGFSACYKPDGRYGVVGNPETALNPAVETPKCISPHAITLSLDSQTPNKGMTLLQRLTDMGYLDKNYGFPDGIDVTHYPFATNDTRCLVDQAMTILAFHKFQEKMMNTGFNGYRGINKYTANQVEAVLQPLLSMEGNQFSSHLSTSMAAAAPMPAAVIA